MLKILRKNITRGDRSHNIDLCKVRSTMFTKHRGYRSSVLFGYQYELLYKETVQSFQKLGGLHQMFLGFISNVQGKVMDEKFLVIRKVRHS